MSQILKTIEAIAKLPDSAFVHSVRQPTPFICAAHLRELAEAYERAVKGIEWFEQKYGFKLILGDCVIENNIWDAGSPPVKWSEGHLCEVDPVLIVDESYPRPVELPSAPSGGGLGETER